MDTHRDLTEMPRKEADAWKMLTELIEFHMGVRIEVGEPWWRWGGSLRKSWEEMRVKKGARIAADMMQEDPAD